MTVARMLERDDFQKRYKANQPISLIEFLYPLVQGRDSVEIEADIELGGSDQLFNMLVGRQLQKDAEQSEQIVITLPLLVGLDGTKKMSKSSDNYIAFNDSAKEMFGKLMSILDDIMWDYYRLLLNDSESAIETLKNGHPMAAKKALAKRLTARFHGDEAGAHELEQFEKVFSKNEKPDDIPEYSFAELSAKCEEPKLIDLLAATGKFPSKKEIKRLAQQGGIKMNDTRVENIAEPLSETQLPATLQAGKRLFIKIV